MSEGTNRERINQNTDNIDLNNLTLEQAKAIIETLPELIDTYKKLMDKPKINNIELVDNKTLEELGIQPAGEYEEVEALSNQEIENLLK